MERGEGVSKERIAQERAQGVRTWYGTTYKIIDHVHEDWDLIATSNGPAITDGGTIATIDLYPSVMEQEHPCDMELRLIRMRAQRVWLAHSWPLVRDKWFPGNKRMVPREGGGFVLVELKEQKEDKWISVKDRKPTDQELSWEAWAAYDNGNVVFWERLRHAMDEEHPFTHFIPIPRPKAPKHPAE